ncbi:MAG: phosphotransferase [Anaerolineae bacterium]|nr:phosphotransferase [Anaerolineae bacterium]
MSGVEVTQIELSGIWDVPAGCVLRPLGRGYNNYLYRLHDYAGAPLPYVLRVYGNHANPKYIQHEISVLMQLAEQALPFAVPAPILTRRGEPWALVDSGHQIRLMVLIPFIRGKNPDVHDLGQAEGAGRAMALLHAALARVESRGAGAPRPYIELGRVHPLVPDPFEAMRAVGSLASRLDVARVDAVLERIYAHEKRIRALPQQLIHGDYITGNILMEGSDVTAVLDFENCALNPRGMDFAIAIDTWCWDVIGSGREWERVAALARGYGRAGRFSDEEIALLPVMVLLRNANVLMHLVGRFLSNLSPYVDVASWLESLARVDAWLTLHGQRLTTEVRRHLTNG